MYTQYFKKIFYLFVFGVLVFQNLWGVEQYTDEQKRISLIGGARVACEELDGRAARSKLFELIMNDQDNFGSIKRGILGEEVSIRFFMALGYEKLEDHFKIRCSLKKQQIKEKGDLFEDADCKIPCTTKNSSDNGIDLIFIRGKSVKDSRLPCLVIHEAKTRTSKNNHYRKLHIDFTEFKNTKNGQQTSHAWNQEHIKNIKCATKYLEQSSGKYARTASLLNDDAELYFYAIGDKGNKFSDETITFFNYTMQFSTLDQYDLGLDLYESKNKNIEALEFLENLQKLNISIIKVNKLKSNKKSDDLQKTEVKEEEEITE